MKQKILVVTFDNVLKGNAFADRKVCLYLQVVLTLKEIPDERHSKEVDVVFIDDISFYACAAAPVITTTTTTTITTTQQPCPNGSFRCVLFYLFSITLLPAMLLVSKK